MRVLDCFAGIGGFSKGLEAAGMTTVGFCEIEPFPRAVLKKHWPNIWCHDDVRTLTSDLVQQRCGTVELLCGGVPCQPASVAGKRQGAADDRWLWGEFMRIVRTVRPRWVVAENVPGFLSLGDESEAVFRELESEGYEVWPLVLGADDVGAPHRRKRLWIVANSERGESGTGHKFDMQRRRAREAEQIRMGCGIQLANLTSGGFGIDGSAPRRGGHVDECGEGVANGNGSLGIHADQKIRSGRISAVNGRWPARPGERQHEWEQPRIIKFGVGFCAVRIFRWLDGRFLGERYGKATKTRPSEVLRVLLGEAGEEEIRRFVGGHDEVYAETILQHQLHGTEADIRNPDSPNDVQAGWGSQEDILRTLRRIDEFGYSSHRRESDEQCSREHQDALRFVSHEITLANREIGTPEGVLCRVWKRCESARILPETLVPLGEVWRSVADEEKLRAVQGTIGPCLVKRMSRWNKNSLRCFGNSIVPQCSEAIGRAIMQVEQQTKGSNHEA